jgi:hypothetical protein
MPYQLDGDSSSEDRSNANRQRRQLIIEVIYVHTYFCFGA